MPTQPTYRNDHATDTFDRLTRAAPIESAYVGLATRIALVALIPSLILSGIIGAIGIMN